MTLCNAFHTRSARLQNRTQSDTDKNQLWSNYYDRRSESQTQLGNTYGQMAEYYGLANEQRSTKRLRRRRKAISDASGDAFMDAAHTAGHAHANRPANGLANWKGAADFKSTFNSNLNAGVVAQPVDLARPEGATLRRFPS